MQDFSDEQDGNTVRKTLKDALRQVRISSVERSDVIVDLREAEIARLELLQEALADLIAELPENDDHFEITLVPSHPPRLWIDMLSYVVMGRDKHLYRFVKDTRNGREVLAESADRGEVVNAITDYVAYRLLEREKAFAAERHIDPAIMLTKSQAPAAEPAPLPKAEALVEAAPQPVMPVAPKAGFSLAAVILAYLLGALSSFIAIIALAWFLTRSVS